MENHVHPFYLPLEVDSNFPALEMHYLCMPIRESSVGFPWARVSGLCENESHILLTAGADTTTIMVSWILYKLDYI